MSEEYSTTITFEDRDEALLLCGSRDQHLKLIRDVLGVRTIPRGIGLQIAGSTQEHVDKADRVFDELRRMLKAQKTISSENVRNVLDAIHESDQIDGPQVIGILDGARKVRPRTDGQSRYVNAMRDNDLVFCIGPAGTGKTYLAVAVAASMLRQGAVKRIVLVRPAVEAGERLGFLPGDIAAKVNPYLRPLFDALHDMLEADQIKRYMENDIIEIAPLAFMRGRTLNESVIILDEAQNTTVQQMKMFLTRMGNGSKIIVTGDVTQVDLPKQMRSGLTDAVHRLKDLSRIKIVYLSQKDIVRHPLVHQIVVAYES